MQDIITEPVPMKKENGWPLFYVVRFSQNRIYLHSYKIDRDSGKYVIADNPGYAIDVSKGLIMADHAQAVRDAVEMAGRLFRGDVKENLEAYHWVKRRGTRWIDHDRRGM